MLISLDVSSAVIDSSFLDRELRESDRDIRQEAEKHLEGPRTAPPNIEKENPLVIEQTDETFYIRKINIVGNESLPIEKLRPIISDCEQRVIGINNLKTLSEGLRENISKKA